MRAVRMAARSAVRRRWREIVILSLVTGILGGAVLLSFTGARRTSSSFERLMAVTRVHHVEVQLVEEGPPDLFERMGRLPAVEAAARAAVIPSDTPGGGFTWDMGVVALIDDNAMRDVDRPVVVEGRMHRIDIATEAVVSPEFAAARGVGVGDQVGFDALSFPEMFEFFGSGRVTPSQPTYTVTVVGIVRLPHDARFGVESNTQRGLLYLSPGFIRAHGDNLATLELLWARLRGGAGAVPAFIREATALTPDPNVVSFVGVDQLRRAAERALDVQAAALWLFGALAALAGLTIVGQGLSRLVAGAADGSDAYAALGMSRSQRALAASGPGVVVVGVGVLLALVAAVAASPLMPLGLAREIDPDIGLQFELLVLLGGTAAMAALMIVRLVPPALGAARTGLRSVGLTGRSRPSTVAGALARAGASPAATTGVRFATDPRAGRLVVPVRGAMLGSVAGLLAIVAAITFGRSLTAAIDDPKAYGWNWDGDTAGSEDEEYLARAKRALLGDPVAAEVARVDIRSVAVGEVSVKVFGFESYRGSISPVVVRGRAPQSAKEAAVGRETLALLGAEIGSDVSLPAVPDSCAERTSCTSTFQVVGEAVLPPLDENELGHGLATTRDAVGALAGTSGFTDHLVRFAPGIDRARSAAKMAERHGAWAPPYPPADVVNLGRVEGYPYALAGLLGIVALASVAHALIASVRRRRHELAILRVLGFVRGQLASVVAWQASTLLVLALAIGVPLGLAAGRWAWRVASDQVSLASGPVSPLMLVIVVCVAALVVANVLAALPARAAARTEPAVVLRGD